MRLRLRQGLCWLLSLSIGLAPTGPAFAQGGRGIAPQGSFAKLVGVHLPATYEPSRLLLGLQAQREARLLAALIVEPSLIAAHRPALVAAIGEAAVVRVEAAALAVQTASASDAQVLASAQALKLSLGPEADLSSLLTNFFDGSLAAGGVLTVAEGEDRKTPLTRSRTHQVLSSMASGTLTEKAAATFATLPADPYFKGRGRRYRASVSIEAIPDPLGSSGFRLVVTPGASFRDERGEASYGAMDEALVKSPEFQALVLKLLERLPESEKRFGVRVGVHQIRTEDGEVTPEGRHQDDFTTRIAVWSVARSNAKGGLTRLFAQAEGGKPALVRELKPGEILLLDNKSLWHEVLPIARKSASRPATRDVVVFSFSPISAPVAELKGKPLARALKTARREFSKAAPNVEKLRALYESGGAKLRAALYRGFRAWSRYFAPDGPGDGTSWQFLKSASAPWAGRLYVKQVESFFEWVAAQKQKEIDAAAEAKKVHDADRAFTEELVKQVAEELGLDPEEAAHAVSDEVLYALVIRPLMERRQTQKWDRSALTEALAERLKATLFLYDDEMTLERVRALLAQEGVKSRFDLFLDRVEEHLPPESSEEKGEASLKSRSKGRNGAALGLFLVTAAAWAWNALSGSAEGDGFALLAGSLAVGLPGGEEGKKKGPPLPTYMSDLTESAAQGLLNPVYLRGEAIASLVQVLNKTALNNIFLLGEAGVGKTSVVEGLAQEMAAQSTLSPLDQQRIVSLDVSKFLAVAAKSPDAFAREVEVIVAAVSDGRTVLYIDEAHRLSRDYDPALFGGFYDQLKIPMTQGKLKLVLSTTQEEHRKYLSKDAALNSRAKSQTIEPIRPGPATGLLYDIRERYQQGSVKITYAAAKAAVEMSVRVFRFDALLRMAVDAMDAAATRVFLRSGQIQRRLSTLRQDLGRHLDSLVDARRQGDLGRQDDLLEQIQTTLDDFAAAREESKRPVSDEVTAADVEAALRDMGAPVGALSAGSPEHLAAVEALLRKNLIGRDELIDRTLDALKRRFAQPNLKRPVFRTLLLGATGTGKTEFVRLLGKAFFRIDDVEKSVIKINGGEYQMKHDMATLIGSRPGYVGYGETDTLMAKVRRQGESIILVDEVEKMHPDILKLFLSILDDGVANDGEGRPADFSNTIIVFTSNYGVPKDYDKLDDAAFQQAVQSRLLDADSPFSPEFLNRLDSKEVFSSLSKEEARQIARLRLDGLIERWKREQGIEVVLTERAAFLERLLAEGFSRRDNARPLNRALNKLLEDPLSAALVAGTLRRGDRATLTADGKLDIAASTREEKALTLFAKTPGGAALAERLEAYLKEVPADGALSSEVLDALLGLREAEPLPSPYPDFKPGVQSDAMKVHAPGAKDPVLNDALKALKQDLAGASEDSSAVALKGAKALVRLGKRLNLDAALGRGEGGAGDFAALSRQAAELEAGARAALEKRLKAAVILASAESAAAMAWKVEGGRLILRVEAGGVDWTAETRLKAALFGEPTAGGDAAVAELRDALERAGGRLAYETAPGRTTLWLELPLSPSSDAAAQEKTDEKTVVVIAPVVETKTAVEIKTDVVPAPEPTADEAALAARAEALMDEKVGDEAAFMVAAELEAALVEGAAGAGVARALERGLDAYLKYRIVKSGYVGSKDAVETGGTYAPPKRIRDLFELYTALLAARPDLVPDDHPARLLRLWSVPWHWNSNVGAETMDRRDESSSGVRRWELAMSRRWAELGLRARPGSWTTEDLAQGVAAWQEIEETAQAYHGAGFSWGRVALGALVLASAIAVGAVLYTGPLAALTSAWLWGGLGTGALSVLGLRYVRRAVAGRVADEAGSMVARFEGELYRSAAVESPDKTLKLLAELDVEKGRWHAKPAFTKVFARLLKLGPFARAAAPRDGGPEKVIAPVAAEKTDAPDPLGAMVESLIDKKVPEKRILETITALEDVVGRRPGRATPGLARALETALGLLAKSQKEKGGGVAGADTARIGDKVVPDRRLRALFELYAGLLAARPDLIPADIAPRLQAFWEVPPRAGDEDSRRVVGWEHDRVMELTRLALELRPALFAPWDLAAASAALAAHADALEKAVKDESEALFGFSTIVGGIALIATGISWINTGWPWDGWDEHIHWNYWVLGGAGAGLLFYFWDARREARGYRAHARELDDAFYRAALQAAPKSVLPLIADFDGEKKGWVAKPGRAKLLSRLAHAPEYASELKR